jgi:hypothetical protein
VVRTAAHLLREEECHDAQLGRWLGESRNISRVRIPKPRQILDERFAKGEIDHED